MRYTKEQLNFIKETRRNHSIDDTLKIVNAKFNFNLNKNIMNIICSRYGFTRSYNKNIPVDTIAKETKFKNDLYTKIADIYYSLPENIRRSFSINKVDVIKFYSLIMSDDLINRRSEFYSLFKNESSADYYWTKYWDNNEI